MNVPNFLGQGNRYRILEQVGQGGMGAVFRAEDTNNPGRDVAIKILLDSATQEAHRLFEREWRTLSSLQDTKIIDIREQGVFMDGPIRRPFFVMPFLKGRTLQEVINKSPGALSPERVVQIIWEAGSAIHYAHVNRVLHRDLKPSNIFLLESGSVMVIDFGIAHLGDSNERTEIKGTAAFLAPELVTPRNPSQPSVKSDLFSLAVTCYQALTGKNPFQRTSQAETLNALLYDVPAPAYELNPAVSEALSQVVHRAMAKNPANRFTTVEEFLTKLVRASRNEAIPEFDRAVVEARLKPVREAFYKEELSKAELLLKQLEDIYISPGIVEQRQTIGLALKRKRLAEQIDAARFAQPEVGLGMLDELLQDLGNESAWSTERDRALAERDRLRVLAVDTAINSARGALKSGQFEQAREQLERAADLQGQEDTVISGLRQNVTRVEQKTRALNERKESLFRRAQAARHNGHVDTALQLLQQIVDLLARQGSQIIGQRDAVYKSFYQDLVTETKQLRASFDEASENLRSGNFAHAVAICDRVLAENPTQPLFVGLKLDIENSERAQRLEYVRDVSSTVPLLPSLERQVTLLQEASQKFPQESQISDLLRSAKAKRDLIITLCQDAKKAEESAEFGTAVERWKAVRRFHAGFPGVDAEIDRLERRRQEQARVVEKQCALEDINEALHDREFSQALDLCEDACKRFEGDSDFVAELIRFRKTIADRMAQAEQANDLIAEARSLIPERRVEALDLLRKARKVDPPNPDADAMIGRELLRLADQSIAVDPMGAKLLVEEACEHGASGEAVERLLTKIGVDRPSSNGHKPVEPDYYREPSYTFEEDPVPLPPSNRTPADPIALTPPPSEPVIPVVVTEQSSGEVPRSNWMTALLARPTALRNAGILAAVCVLIAAILVSTRAKPKPPNTPVALAQPVTIFSIPESASLHVNNGAAGTGRLSLKLNPGSYSVTGTAEGFSTETVPFTVGRLGESVEVTLKPLLATSVSSAVPGTQLIIDNRPAQAVDSATPASTSVEAQGDHTFIFKSGAASGTATIHSEVPLGPRIDDLSGSDDFGILALAIRSGTAQIMCTFAPVKVVIDNGAPIDIAKSGAEVPWTPGDHTVALQGDATPPLSVLGAKTSQVVLAALSRQKTEAPKPASVKTPEASLSDVDAAINAKQYRRAYSLILRFLQDQPNNVEAIDKRRQLEKIKTLDPDNWK